MERTITGVLLTARVLLLPLLLLLIVLLLAVLVVVVVLPLFAVVLRVVLVLALVTTNVVLDAITLEYVLGVADGVELPFAGRFVLWSTFVVPTVVVDVVLLDLVESTKGTSVWIKGLRTFLWLERIIDRSHNRKTNRCK